MATIDLGQYAQQAYDSGKSGVTLDRNNTWALDTPVFLDRPTFGDAFEINLNGAEVTVGKNLPTAGGAFSKDSTVRVAFFPNTKRQALSGGNVDVKNGKATSSGAAQRLRLRDGRFVVGRQNVGLVLSNRCGSVLDNVRQQGGRFAYSWYDYADQHRIVNGHFQTAQVEDAYYVYGTTKGDGVLVDGIKCDGAIGGVSLTGCFGAVINAGVTAKVRIINGTATISGHHQEAGIYESFAPNFEITNSQVVLNGGDYYPPRKSGAATFEVSGDSTVVLVGPTYRLLSGHASTAQQFVKVSGGAKVTLLYPTFKKSTGPGQWVTTNSPSLPSTVKVVY